MNRAVADASAVLAFAVREAGWETAMPLLRGSLISAVNAAEVTSRYIAEGGSMTSTRGMLDDLYVVVSPFDAERRSALANCIGRPVRTAFRWETALVWPWPAPAICRS